jgi:hypothetical protein
VWQKKLCENKAGQEGGKGRGVTVSTRPCPVPMSIFMALFCMDRNYKPFCLKLVTHMEDKLIKCKKYIYQGITGEERRGEERFIVRVVSKEVSNSLIIPPCRQKATTTSRNARTPDRC